MKTHLLAGFMATLLVLGAGCAVNLGNRTSPTKPNAATLGQELVDLKAARDAGAISEAEYQSQRTRLLGEEKSR